jgi:hypothetical protein
MYHLTDKDVDYEVTICDSAVLSISEPVHHFHELSHERYAVRSQQTSQFLISSKGQ